MLDTPRNYYAVRRQRGKLHSVTYIIAPKSGIGRYNERIVYPQLYILQSHSFGGIAEESIGFYELVENTRIEQ